MASIEEVDQLLKDKRPTEAQAMLVDMLGQRPSTDELAEIEYRLGIIHFRMDNYGDAKSSFKRAIEAQNTHVNSQYYLGLIHERTGDHVQAERQYRMVLALDSNHTEAKKKLSVSEEVNQSGSPPVSEEETAADEDSIGVGIRHEKKSKSVYLVEKCSAFLVHGIAAALLLGGIAAAILRFIFPPGGEFIAVIIAGISFLVAGFIGAGNVSRLKK